MRPAFEKYLSAAKGRMFAPEHFTGADLSYRFGKAVFHAGDSIKSMRREIRRWLFSPRLASRRLSLLRRIRNHDWQRASQEALALGTLAERMNDPRLMEEVGQFLARLGEYERSSALRLKSHRLRRHDERDWAGEYVEGVLHANFIENDGQGMGGTLKRGFFLHVLSDRAKFCTAMVQPRLLPLFERTFPKIEFLRDNAASLQSRLGPASRIACAQHLDAYIGRDSGSIQSLFSPLKPDAGAVDGFKRRYRKTCRPLIGISWGSSAYAKEVPSLEDWSRLLRETDADFVSLQYGNVAHDIAELQQKSGKTIIDDKTVDQLTDMDRFAAQIAALDAVITISNTGAHMTGALGIPMIVLNDGNFRRSWPVNSERTPYYPKALLLTKSSQPWSALMDKAGEKLVAMCP